jgi:hypothetical protein
MAVPGLGNLDRGSLAVALKPWFALILSAYL